MIFFYAKKILTSRILLLQSYKSKNTNYEVLKIFSRLDDANVIMFIVRLWIDKIKWYATK